MYIWPGSPYPLGAVFDGGGTNFALFSEVADRIELCLFDENGVESQVDLPARARWSGLAWLPAAGRSRVGCEPMVVGYWASDHFDGGGVGDGAGGLSTGV
jgi:pullulanase/glycogen debranching enzyme